MDINDYYKKVNYAEYNKFDISDNYSSFSENQVNIIKNIIDFDLRNDDNGNYLDRDDLLINAYKDEWYSVSIGRGEKEYFICDQFDGLIKCIEDKLKDKYGK